MLKEFKEFAMRGNVVDMAVGISEDNAYCNLFLFESKTAGFIYIFSKKKACRLTDGFYRRQFSVI